MEIEENKQIAEGRIYPPHYDKLMRNLKAAFSLFRQKGIRDDNVRLYLPAIYHEILKRYCWQEMRYECYSDTVYGVKIEHGYDLKIIVTDVPRNMYKIELDLIGELEFYEPDMELPKCPETPSEALKAIFKLPYPKKPLS